MPLQDHFHPPLSARRHWHAFHNAWATYLASDLNQRLPDGYFAEPNVQFGIEIDVAAFEEQRASPDFAANAAWGTDEWTAPAPTRTVPFPLVTDVVEVLVYDSEAGPTLAGAIELVSPANKDRPQHREAFVSKCETYLYQGVGLVVADIVTSRQANLHDELMKRLDQPNEPPLRSHLYMAAYRPVGRNGDTNLDIWQYSVAIGDKLPTMPLFLRGGWSLPVEFEATYDRTCREQRVTID